jgi:exonuclease SbcC
MRIKENLTFLAKFLLLVLSSQITAAYSQGSQNEKIVQNDTSKIVIKTDLQDKYYRQALYFYFQGDQKKALSQVERSKAKLTSLDSRSALFEAGLQLSAGLLQQAKATLVDFDKLLDTEKELEKRSEKSTKASELRLIALLSLTNQYLSQGNTRQAKDTLARIESVSSTYYQEYHVLNQLAYWPDNNSVLLAKPAADATDNSNSSSPYIQLNEALRLIELAQVDEAQYDLAIKALKTIKIMQWHQEPHNFWKRLFLDEASVSSLLDEQRMAALQGQAIQDYAQLLLAQIYISQERYNLAFSELKTFPEQSPYAESALFLFAFASQQVDQFDIAFNLLNLLYKKYPYSQLSWQSAELLAQQVSDQQSLAQGVSAYQTVETFFIQRQQDLRALSLAFDNSINLLNFSSSIKASSLSQSSQNSSQQSLDYMPQSLWLQQALYDAELASLYQGLNAIDEQTAQLQGLLDKTVWLAEIISLNQQRKKNIITAQETRDKQDAFAKLKDERDRLSILLSEQLANKQSSVFANEEERQWLNRIARSNTALNAIGDKKNTVEYKERLARVEGVLSWQLAEQYPQRSWQHKKQLQQLDAEIIGVTVLQQKIAHISNTQGSLELSINKHSQSEQQLEWLLAQSTQLREKTTVKIREKVKLYIDDQHVVLAEHLLSTRQGMANVLERMAREDKRLSIKLVPSVKLPPSNNILPIAGVN